MLHTPIMVLAVALVAAATPSPAPSSSATTNATIHMRNFAFIPKTLTVAAGTSVTVINDDDEAHTVSAIDKSFDSAGLDAHESWSHVFTKIGTYAYLCELHPYMKGVIVVRPAASKGSS